MVPSRSVVSYDDITPSFTTGSSSQDLSRSSNASQSSKYKSFKKAKGRGHENLSTTFKTLPPLAASPPCALNNAPGDIDEDNENRELTHEEIWDDTALIEAWDAATEEYDAYNGLKKAWKGEPIHQSSLWYNVPKTAGSTTKIGCSPHTLSLPDAKKDDSHPMNFDTFAPTHDPSLQTPMSMELPHVPEPSSLSQHSMGPMVSRDEAFSRAMGAMYWSGYWTAMYHVSHDGVTEENDKQPGLL